MSGDLARSRPGTLETICLNRGLSSVTMSGDRNSIVAQDGAVVPSDSDPVVHIQPPPIPCADVEPGGSSAAAQSVPPAVQQATALPIPTSSEIAPAEDGITHATGAAEAAPNSSLPPAQAPSPALAPAPAAFAPPELGALLAALTHINDNIQSLHHQMSGLGDRLSAVETRPANPLPPAAWPSLIPATERPPPVVPSPQAIAAAASALAADISNAMQIGDDPPVSAAVGSMWAASNARYALLNRGTAISQQESILSCAQHRENCSAMEQLAASAHAATELEMESIDCAEIEARSVLALCDERRAAIPAAHVANAQAAVMSLPHAPMTLGSMTVMDEEANISERANLLLFGSNEYQVSNRLVATIPATPIQTAAIVRVAVPLVGHDVGTPVSQTMHIPGTNSAVIQTPIPMSSIFNRNRRTSVSAAVQASKWVSAVQPPVSTPFVRFPVNFLAPTALFQTTDNSTVIPLPFTPVSTNPAVPVVAFKFCSTAPVGVGKTKANSKALPQPALWEPSKLASLPSPRIWFELMNDYVVVNNLHLPSHFKHFLSGQALLWYDDLSEQYNVKKISLDTDMIRGAFLTYYKTSLKDDDVVARDILYSGTVSMSKYPNFNDYELHFKTTVRKALMIAMKDQVYWFLKGLTPALHILARVQPITHIEWVTVDDLISFVKGHLLRVADNTAEPVFNFITSNSSSVPAPLAIQPLASPKFKKTSRQQSQQAADCLQGRDKRQRFPATTIPAGQPTIPARPLPGSPDHISVKEGKERLSHICQDFDSSYPYWLSEGKKMYGDFCIKMRLDNWCPRCHRKGHQDFNKHHVLTCKGQEARPGFWPDGLFVKGAKNGAEGFPTNAAQVISKMWLNANPQQGR